ncbi:MAG: S1C family serine protease [Pyrinomonadaceae bacterium]
MKMVSVRNKKRLQTTLILNLILFAGWFLPDYVSAQRTVDKKLPPREIAQQTLPSTVLLVMNNSDTKEAKSGSGFFIAEDIVVTNFHVIKETTEGYAKIYGQNKIYDILGVVGVDEKNDLALLKIKGIKGKALKLNKDDSTAIGDEVFAVGNPKGLEGTFSQGIVSSIRKTDKNNLLQITASISPGSSGGVILNNKGEVIGVAVGAIESGQSLNFAIPVSLLRVLISKIKPLVSISAIGEPSNNKNSSLQFKVSDIALENLVGNIKSVKEYVYSPEIKFGKVELGEPTEIALTEYNSEGNVKLSELNSFALYPKDYGLDDYTPGLKPSFGEAVGIYKEEREYDYLNKTVTINYKSYVDGRNYSGASKSIKYKNNKITEEIDYASKGKISSKKVIQINGDGKTIEIEYDEEGKEYRRKEITAYINERNQNVSEVEDFASYGRNKYREVKIGATKIEKSLLGNTNNTYETITKNLDSKTNSVKLTTIIYMDNPNIQRQDFVYEYEFDSNGNWTKRIAYEQISKSGKTYLEPFNILVREITYFSNTK